MRALEAIRRPVVTVAPDATLAHGAQLMANHGVGTLVVLDDGCLVGIVTDRDLVVRAMAHGIPSDGRIDAVMTADVFVLDAEADVSQASAAFRRHGVRRLPVLRAGAVVGVLSVDDLVGSLVSELNDVVRPVTTQVMSGHRVAMVPAVS